MTIRSLMFSYARTAGKAAIQLALLLNAPTLAHSQTIVPVDRKVPPPKGFSFQGTWSCSDALTAGKLIVRPVRQVGQGALGLSNNWTEVIEEDGNTTGHYFIAYDRDKRQFVIIDADDPAYAAYSTDGWHDRQLTLTPVVSKEQSPPWHRLVYEVRSSAQFIVTWELWQEGGWNAESIFACNRKQNLSRK
jgi:hypothetical protein